MIMQNERGQNTHSERERVKIPLLPNNVGERSVNDSGTFVGSRQFACLDYWHKTHLFGFINLSLSKLSDRNSPV